MAYTSLIKYEGDNNTFIWKHPCEDFNSLSQLIVHESQEAVFFLNGQALDLFGPGRHTLETENIPKLGGLLHLVSGSKSAFHCEVYFINKTVQMNLKWGTDSPIHFIDPDTGVPIGIGAGGSMNLAVCDSRKLLIKLVGTMKGIAWDDASSRSQKFENRSNMAQSLQSSFRSMINVELKSNLGNEIKNNNYDILELDLHLMTLSEKMKVIINASFEEYGLTVPNFYIERIVFPEQDINLRKIRDLRSLSLQKRMIQAEGEIRTAQAEMEANVIAANRQTEMERQTTATEVARREAQRTVIEADGRAEALKSVGLAEAEVMRAKGYTQKDVIDAGVQKAYAEGIGKMMAGGGGGSSLTSDVVGTMTGIKIAGTLFEQMNGVLSGNQNTQTNSKAFVKCPECNAELPENSQFCLNCGHKIEQDNMIKCPGCGNIVKSGKFCMKCGCKLVPSCPQCGTEISTGSKFCSKCGFKLSQSCPNCGADITVGSKFCNECGTSLE